MNNDKALVISAFPACGKSTYYRDWSSHYKDNKCDSDEIAMNILDSDSSDFSWIKDVDGNNTTDRNPDFPNNYIKHIKDNLYTEDIIFVSSHDIVRKALEENDIEYVIIYPDKELKSEWEKRMIDRGNNEKFVNFILSNWDKFIDDIEAETFPKKYKLKDNSTGRGGINPLVINDLLFNR